MIRRNNLNGDNEKQNTKEKQDRRRQSRAYGSGNWFMLPRPFIRVLGANCGVMLSFLIDTAEKTKAEIKDEGWFACTREYMTRHLGLDRNAQHRFLTQLINGKLIQMKMEGMPAQRRIRVNWKRVEMMLDKEQKEREDLYGLDD